MPEINVNQTPPPSPEPMTVEPKKNKLPFILGGIVILLILLAGGFFMFSRGGSNNPSEGTNKQTLQDNQSSSDLNTSSWQTYKQNQFEYEFKYPKNATAVGFSDLGQEVVVTANSNPVGVKFTDSIIFRVNASQPTKSFDQYVTDSGVSASAEIKKTSTTVGSSPSLQAYKVTNDSISGKTWYYVNAETAFYQLTLSNSAEASAILGTFKHMKQAVVDTSAWTTYKNEELKIEFNHPSSYQVAVNDQSSGQGRRIMLQVAKEGNDSTMDLAVTSGYYIGDDGIICCVNLNDKFSMQSSNDALISFFNDKLFNKIFGFAKVTVGGKQGVKFYRFNQASDYWFNETIVVPHGNSTWNPVMITGPTFYRSGTFSADDAIKQAQDVLDNKKYNANIAENIRIYDAIVSTLKFNF